MSRPPHRATLTMLALMAAGGVAAACGSVNQSALVPGGDAQRGHGVIVAYGCGSCHQIGGVAGADGQVGPSLQNFRSDRYIAGRLPTTPDSTVRWIMDPQAIEPDTIMPDLGLTLQQARDVVAYLYQQ